MHSKNRFSYPTRKTYWCNVTTIGTGCNITGTTYNWQNLPTAITKSGTTYNYRYDHHAGGRTSAGLRVYKQEGDNIHTLRGAFGEVLAVNKNGSHDYWNIVRPDGIVIGRRDGSVGIKICNLLKHNKVAQADEFAVRRFGKLLASPLSHRAVRCTNY